MAKKSKSKTKAEAEAEADVEPQPIKPEVAEAVKQQVANQDSVALANVFSSSAFAKKKAYAVVEDKKQDKDDGKVEEKQDEAKDDDKKSKSEKKKEKKKRKLQKKKEKEADEAQDGEKQQEQQQEETMDDEKNRRTVFVGNVSLDATQKDLQRHFSVCGNVESVRLRYLPIAGCAVDQAGNQKLMMKVCAIKKILSDAKDNCNAYVTFANESSVDAALKLTGTTLVQMKIRVDHCDPVIDARRSVFIGNVPFKCTDEQMLLFFNKRLRTDEEPEPVENVRLIRDRVSGLGKGFGYLLLKTTALVAKTLALKNLKMEARELRVQVCGKRFKNRQGEETAKEKYEGVRASAGAHARILVKRKAGADAEFSASKKVKRTAAAAGLGKKLKPKHAARKAAQAAAENAADSKPTKKRKHDHGDKKAAKPKAKKPINAARKARQAAEKK